MGESQPPQLRQVRIELVTAGQRRLDRPGLQAHESLDTCLRHGCCGRACGPRAGSGGHAGLPGGPLPTRRGGTTSRKLSVTDALLQLESRGRWRRPLLPDTCKGGHTWCSVRTAGTRPGGSCRDTGCHGRALTVRGRSWDPVSPEQLCCGSSRRLFAWSLKSDVFCPCPLLSLHRGRWLPVRLPASAGRPFNALGAEILLSMPLSKQLFQIIVKFSL